MYSIQHRLWKIQSVWDENRRTVLLKNHQTFLTHLSIFDLSNIIFCFKVSSWRFAGFFRAVRQKDDRVLGSTVGKTVIKCYHWSVVPGSRIWTGRVHIPVQPVWAGRVHTPGFLSGLALYTPPVQPVWAHGVYSTLYILYPCPTCPGWSCIYPCPASLGWACIYPYPTCRSRPCTLCTVYSVYTPVLPVLVGPVYTPILPVEADPVHCVLLTVYIPMSYLSWLALYIPMSYLSKLTLSTVYSEQCIYPCPTCPG